MSDMSQGLPNQGSAGVTDAVTQLRGIVRQLGACVTAFQGRMVFGTITLDAAADTVVPNTAAQGNSYIIPLPANQDAAQLMGGAQTLWVSAKSPGTSFTFSTANGVAAAGTEIFSYIMITPV